MKKKRKTCGPQQKMIFKTYEDAVAAGWKSSRVFGKTFRVYDCMDHWHVSSRPADRYGLPKKGTF